MSKAAKAALLSFVIPGLGQLYNGDLFRGFLWFAFAWVVGLSLSPMSMGVASLIYHALCARAAYKRCSEKFGHGATLPS